MAAKKKTSTAKKKTSTAKKKTSMRKKKSSNAPRRVPTKRTNRSPRLRSRPKRGNKPKARTKRRRRNPAGGVKGKIPGTIEKIFYRRTGKNAGPYVHDFSTPAEIVAMNDGSIVIRPRRRGTKLWTEI